MDPNSVQGRGVLGSLANLPYMDPAIAQSPMHSQLAVQRGTQFIQNNPIVLQREAAQKAADERRGLVKSMIGDYSQQGQVGFQEGLGAFDNPAGFDLTRQDRITRAGELEAGKTTAKLEAQRPFKDEDLQRSLRLKQTPGARATGPGGAGTGNQPGGDVVSSVTNEDIGRMEKMLKGNKEFFTETQTGGSFSGKSTKSLNEVGTQVLESAADKLSRMKKKNPLLAVKQAMTEYKEKQGNIMSQMPPKPGNLNQRQAPQPNQAPAPTAPPQTKVSTQDPATSQKIAALKARGVPDEKIKAALKADGLNPEDYGL